MDLVFVTDLKVAKISVAPESTRMGLSETHDGLIDRVGR
jgi:hypothetical protein